MIENLIVFNEVESLEDNKSYNACEFINSLSDLTKDLNKEYQI